MALVKREMLCGDGVDNDGDGARDCADSDCAGATGCGNPAGPEAGHCNDGIDNDNDGLRDCEDVADCNGASCGAGCVCGAAGKKTEANCTDTLDNDGDGLTDCADPDCVGLAVENCSDGIDNNCNKAIDCADATCAGNAACVGLADGKGCSLDSQCAGGRCRTELTTGDPNGSCTNAAGCTVSGNVGCNGGICTADSAGTFCRMYCTGDGLGATGRCRAGWACLDPDPNANPATDNSYCVPVCRNDSDCYATAGCNPWSRRCESKDKGLAKTGAACGSDSACESGACFKALNGGYCTSRCALSAAACGGDGVCVNPGNADNVGTCYDGCVTGVDCRPAPYTCRVPSGTSSKVCYCGVPGDFCGSSADCCGGSCLSFGLLKVCF
jgi:hypothetical protein